MRLDPSSSPIVVRDALASGATPGMLRASSLVMPTRGALVDAERAALDPRAALIESLRPLAREDRCSSHTTAARLPGMHLGASILAVAELVEVGDWIVHRDRAGRLAPSDLLAHARELRGARGMRSVLAAIPQIRVGADSPGETRTRLLLRRAGLPEPVLQHRVRDGRGRRVATLDMAYPELHVGIEHEGAHHHLDAGRFAYDIRGYATLEALRWRILRVTHADIRDRGARVIPLIRAAGRDGGHSMS